MSKSDGGGAFPALDDAGTGLHLREHGLSKREYFAAKALPGLMARNWSHMGCSDTELMGVWVASSYRMADLMLAESAK